MADFLNKVTALSKEQLEVESIEVVADKGYESREDILNCLMNGTVPNVVFKYDKTERLYNIPYIESEITEEIRCSKKPEDIRRCLSSGILPNCYEGTSVSVELQTKSSLSCFVLNEDGTVTCPMGNILRKLKTKGKANVYESKDACRQCPNRCTSSSSFKTVSFGATTNCVPVIMYGSPRIKLQVIPKDAKISPYNHTLDRLDCQAEKKIFST